MGSVRIFRKSGIGLDYYKGKEFMSRVIVILFVSVASGQSVEILFVFKSPFWTKKYKNVEFYRLKSLHFRYISKISKFRTKISDLGNFLYGICRFYAIYTKTTLTLQVQTKLSRKRELLGFWDAIYPLIFSLHKNRISLHRIEFQRKSGDIKKEMFEWNKIRGSRRRMLKIAICDDEQPIREYLKRLVKKCTEGEIRLFADGGELLADPTAFDLILLDISLNREQNAAEPDGMETARKIRERSDALIIFVTALREYVFEGYDVGAFHYLLKPIDEQKFTEVMDRAICQIRSKKNVEPLVIKVGGNYVRIPVDDILYAENQARKIMLHTKSKKEPYCFYEKMEVLEQKLGDRFFRSHRGFLVNLQEVARYDNSNIELKNGESVFLAKQKYNDFVTAYMKHLRKV